MRLAAALVAGCLILSSGTAHAQLHPSAGVFVQGGVFASIERSPHADVEPDVLGLLPDPSGTVAGGTIGVGAFLNPYLTARAEVALPGTIDQRVERVISGVSGSFETRVQARDVYVLLGFETGANRRVRVSYLAGAVVRRQRLGSVTTIVIPGPFPIIPPRIQRVEQSLVSYGTSLAVGLDAAAALTSRMALAPHVRVVVIGGALSVRPGFHLRWSF